MIPSSNRIAMILCKIGVCVWALSCGMNLLSQRPVAHGPMEEVTEIAPTDSARLTKGSKVQVEVKVSLTPSSIEDVEFISQLTVNERRYPKFDTVISAESATSVTRGSEAMRWTVRVPRGRKMMAQIHLWGLGRSSGTKYEFATMTETYRVICDPDGRAFWLRIQRFFGCCS